MYNQKDISLVKTGSFNSIVKKKKKKSLITYLPLTFKRKWKRERRNLAAVGRESKLRIGNNL